MRSDKLRALVKASQADLLVFVCALGVIVVLLFVRSDVFAGNSQSASTVEPAVPPQANDSLLTLDSQDQRPVDSPSPGLTVTFPEDAASDNGVSLYQEPEIDPSLAWLTEIQQVPTVEAMAPKRQSAFSNP